MAEQWYCSIAGVQAGPFDGAQLKALAAEGRLSPQDYVWLAEANRWVLASELKGLFSNPGLASAVPNASGAPDAAQSRSGRRPILRAKPVEGADEARPQRPSPSPKGSVPPPIPTSPRPEPPRPEPPRPEPPRQNPPQPSPPRPATAAAAGPVEGLGFLEDEYSAPPSASVLGQGLRRDPFSHMKNPKVLLWILLGLMGLLATLIVVLAVVNREGQGLREDRAADASERREAKTPEKKPAASGDGGAKKAKTADTGPIQWLDAAAQDVWVGADVTVKVVGVEIGYPKVLDHAGAVSIPTKPVLVVRLQLTNRATMAKAKYAGWASPNSAVRLKDQADRECFLHSFGPGTMVEGQQKPTSIDPQGSIQDVLVFDLPAETATLLRLTLPGGALGDGQSGHFEIPKTMITSSPRPVATPPKSEFPLIPLAPAASSDGSKPRDARMEDPDALPPLTGDPFKELGIPRVEDPDAKPAPPAATPKPP